MENAHAGTNTLDKGCSTKYVCPIGVRLGEAVRLKGCVRGAWRAVRAMGQGVALGGYNANNINNALHDTVTIHPTWIHGRLETMAPGRTRGARGAPS